ncbi:FGGY carbohydrate kinase domain-containing protein isoform X4 [Mirounga angustirostris]|uniref:FGGY carbohydrate kinase domain-containing protein isoform X4 n=1 Tax=Mirounga angustirostris TaxID=9716 RepID=UPI001E688B9C|nr:FGGY carbohydrate kinase domain-containing protein isoform X4 [Mirounga angustirostris]
MWRDHNAWQRSGTRELLRGCGRWNRQCACGSGGPEGHPFGFRRPADQPVGASVQPPRAVLRGHLGRMLCCHKGDPRRNIIMWLDHRAVSQVHRINETKHSVLRCVGGVMSVEMQAPKLLWLKENLRETCWDKAGHFFDLPDFLSWKATGVSARSLCSVVCKWTYSAEKGWDDSFWKMIGLEDFVADNYSKIAPVPPCTARLASPVFLGFCSRCCLCWEIYLQSSRSPSQLLPRRCPRVPHLAHPPPVRNLLLRKIIPLLFVKLGDEGNQVLPPGASLGHGLTPEAAKDLGLPAGIAVAASLIDAHAGGLGVIGADVRGYGLACEGQPMTSRLAVICGTSSCHMGISKDPIFVPGVWGPYFSAMVPGFWLNEGGQSVTGKLIDHMVQGHAAFPELQAKATARCQSVYAYLNSHLDLIKKARPVGFLTVDLHVWPDFHGNRSPLADLTLKGMVTGLKLSQDLDDLAILYLATVQAIAFGTRLIIEAMEAAGHSISTLFLCGGLSKNPLFVQMHADITGMPVVLSQEVESVLVGAAILGACASGDFASVQEAMARMSKVGKVVLPRLEDKRYYDKKYQVFLKLVEHQKEYAAIMKGD